MSFKTTQSPILKSELEDNTENEYLELNNEIHQILLKQNVIEDIPEKENEEEEELVMSPKDVQNVAQKCAKTPGCPPYCNTAKKKSQKQLQKKRQQARYNTSNIQTPNWSNKYFNMYQQQVQQSQQQQQQLAASPNYCYNPAILSPYCFTPQMNVNFSQASTMGHTPPIMRQTPNLGQTPSLGRTPQLINMTNGSLTSPVPSPLSIQSNFSLLSQGNGIGGLNHFSPTFSNYSSSNWLGSNNTSFFSNNQSQSTANDEDMLDSMMKKKKMKMKFQPKNSNSNLPTQSQINQINQMNQQIGQMSQQLNSLKLNQMNSLQMNQQLSKMSMTSVGNKSYINNSMNSPDICLHISPNNLQENEFNKILIENIFLGKDPRTTLMIKNIPNKYTISTFLDEINAEFKGKYDIFYLPIDYTNKCNLGFAFINFVNAFHIIDFYETYRGKKWKRFNSEKICELVYAKIQGKKELIAHFEKGKVLSFTSEDKRPLILPTPSPPPQIKLPIKLLESFITLYPYFRYTITNDGKFITDKLYSLTQ